MAGGLPPAVAVSVAQEPDGRAALSRREDASTIMDPAPRGASAAPRPGGRAGRRAADGAYPWGLYLHVIVVSLIGGFGVLRLVRPLRVR